MITSPQEDNKDASLAKNIASQQITITTQTADIKRLKETIIAETYTIGQLSKQKEDLKGQIANLEESKIFASDDLDVLNETITTNKTELDTLIGKISQIKDDQDAKTTLFNQTETDLKTREGNIAATEQANSKWSDSISEREGLVVSKEQAIRELVNKL